MTKAPAVVAGITPNQPMLRRELGMGGASEAEATGVLDGSAQCADAAAERAVPAESAVPSEAALHELQSAAQRQDRAESGEASMLGNACDSRNILI